MLGISLEYATDHIWTMEDREGFIGLRLDCGDAGTIYFTPEQASQVIAAFALHLTPAKAIRKIEFKTEA